MGAGNSLAQPSEEPDLFSEELLYLETVVVTGSRTARPISEAPVATEVISSEEIESSGAQNAADLLELHRGLSVTRSFNGAGIQLEGLSADYTLILIDGQRITGRVGGTNDLSRLSTEDIERIEIVRGAGSALYGADAIGGVVNIITKKSKKKLEVGALGSAGTLSSADASAYVGTRQEKFSARLNGGYHQRDPYRLDPSSLSTQGSGFRQFDIGGQLEFDAPERLDVGITAKYTYRDLFGVNASATGAVFDQRNLTETVDVRINPKIWFENDALLSVWTGVSIFRDQYTQDQRGSDALDQFEQTDERLAQAGGQFDVLIRKKHLLTSGVEGFYENLATPRLTANQDRGRVALYMQDEWTVLSSPNFVLVPGVRLDVDTQFGVYPTPRIAARLDPHEDVVLRASFGLGFRAPDFRELYLFFQNPSVGYVVLGNPDLRPETSRSVRAGVEYEPTGWFWVSVYGFRNDLDNMILAALVSGSQPGEFDQYQYQNVASAYTQGSEVSVRLKSEVGVVLDLGYLFLNTRDRETGQSLQGRAAHRGTATLRYTHADIGFRANARVALESKRPYFEATSSGETVTVFASPYAVLDARLSQALGRDEVRLFVYARNITNAGHAVYLPIVPRTVMAGAEIHY